MKYVLWAASPYVCFVVLVGGLIWRRRYDQFGWTSRSSSLYESKVLKIASPVFHYALLAVLLGHVVGLAVPISFTDSIGISNHTYHEFAVLIGGPIGGIMIIALGGLIIRRRRNRSVFRATTANDKVMFVVLGAVVLMGLAATCTGGHYLNGSEHNYRETVSVWFRSLFTLQPNGRAMADAAWQFQVHVVMAMILIAAIPFTRLVHAFAAPLHYLFRPYVVYRSRDMIDAHTRTAAGRGWDAVGTQDNVRSR